MAAEDLVVFVHIEKCAGTALNTWLQLSHHFGNLYVRHANVPMTNLRWSDVSPVDLADPKLRSLASHHLRTYPPAIYGRSLHYISLLRNPIDRWISYCRFFRTTVTDHVPGDVSLREYAEWMLEQPEAGMLAQINGQTNFIAEHEWYRLNRGDVVAIDWTAEPELFERYRRERLAFAQDVLAGFDLVGTVEQLDDFTRILQMRAPAWDVPLIAIDGLNPTHVTPGPPVDASWITPLDSVGKRLIDAFAEDYALHRYAMERQRLASER